MAATRDDISAWFDRGVADSQRFMVVVCDGFDHEDYPCYCANVAECLATYDEHNGKQMQRVMEVYDLALPKDAQMAEYRAMHLPERPPTADLKECWNDLNRSRSVADIEEDLRKAQGAYTSMANLTDVEPEGKGIFLDNCARHIQELTAELKEARKP